VPVVAGDSDLLLGFCHTHSVSADSSTLTEIPENFEFLLNIYFSRWNLGMCKRYLKYV
jgi:hypothetical protein